MGKLYVIESGSDAAGKRTQSELLYKYFEQKGENVKKVEFPNYDSVSSTFVKMYLGGEFGKKPDEVSPYIASIFFAIDRYVTYKKELESFYTKGGIIIADRYTTSNMVYQASKYDNKSEKSKFLDWLFDYEFGILQLPKPDRVFFLDMPFEISYALLQERDKAQGKKSGTKKDIHEDDPDYLKKTYENARFVCENFGWTKIDCVSEGKLLGIEDIQKKIINEL